MAHCDPARTAPLTAEDQKGAPLAGAGRNPAHGRHLTRRKLVEYWRDSPPVRPPRIATAMGVTRSTARTHGQNALTKLGVHSRLKGRGRRRPGPHPAPRPVTGSSRKASGPRGNADAVDYL